MRQKMKASIKKILFYVAIIFGPGLIYFPVYEILLKIYREDGGPTYFFQFYTDFTFLWMMGLLIFALSIMLKAKR